MLPTLSGVKSLEGSIVLLQERAGGKIGRAGRIGAGVKYIVM